MKNSNIKLTDVIDRIDFENSDIQSEIGWEDLINQLNISTYSYYFEQTF